MKTTATRRAALTRYNHTPAGRASRKKYARTEKGMAAATKYRKSPRGRLTHRRAARKFWLSEKGKAYQRNWKYGITPTQFSQMLARQQNRCALCERPFRQTPQVDHCHKTGKVRGLLCRICNTGLGIFHDNPNVLLRAVAYLQK